MGTLRSKTLDIRSGDFRQLKLTDITDPVRVRIVSGAVTIDHYFEGVVVENLTTNQSGPNFDAVYTPTGGAWGSEVRITASADSIVKVSYTG